MKNSFEESTNNSKEVLRADIPRIKIRTENVIESESAFRKLKYVESFKKVVSEHPKLISSFLKYKNMIKKSKNNSDQIKEENKSVEVDGIKISLVSKAYNNHETQGSYYKVETDKEAFFVKTIPGFFTNGLGQEELSSLSNAKNLLKDVIGVEVVDFQLGYDDVHNTTYFVSKWQDEGFLDDYLSSLKGRQQNPQYANLKKRFAKIQKILIRFADVEMHNIFYNPKTDILTIFDIHHRSKI